MKLKTILFFVFFSSLSTLCFAQIDLSPSIFKGKIIQHTHYTLSYVEEHEQAEWVYYELTYNDLQGTTKRVNSYRPDDKVATGSAEAFDYKGSGYDRGHLAPAGDMKRSREAMSESFFYSNMSPQIDAFNQGIWNHLEIKIRQWTNQKKHLYIVTGPIFKPNLGSIGINKVTVPSFFYKVLLTEENGVYQTIAFLLPNQFGNSELFQYAISVDELENISGINFWQNLPDVIENDIESEVVLKDWFFQKELNRVMVSETTPMLSNDLPPNTLNSVDAAQYINQTQTVCGCVVSANYSKRTSATYLNIDYKYPNHIFSLVIFGDNRNNFTGKPEEDLFGEKICATGEIMLLRGIPVIKMVTEADLKILR